MRGKFSIWGKSLKNFFLYVIERKIRTITQVFELEIKWTFKNFKCRQLFLLKKTFFQRYKRKDREENDVDTLKKKKKLFFFWTMPGFWFCVCMMIVQDVMSVLIFKRIHDPVWEIWPFVEFDDTREMWKLTWHVWSLIKP